LKLIETSTYMLHNTGGGLEQSEVSEIGNQTFFVNPSKTPRIKRINKVDVKV